MPQRAAAAAARRVCSVDVSAASCAFAWLIFITASFTSRRLFHYYFQLYADVTDIAITFIEGLLRHGFFVLRIHIFSLSLRRRATDERQPPSRHAVPPPPPSAPRAPPRANIDYIAGFFRFRFSLLQLFRY